MRENLKTVGYILLMFFGSLIAATIIFAWAKYVLMGLLGL